MLVTIEGPDGVGKDTVIDLLVSEYGYKKSIAFPTYKTPDGKTPTFLIDQIRSYLHGDESVGHIQAQVMIAMDESHHAEDLLNMTSKNTAEVYLLNRYLASAIVYGVWSIMQTGQFTYQQAEIICDQINACKVQSDLDICLMASNNVLKDRLYGRHDQSASRYENDESIGYLVNAYSKYYQKNPGIVINTDQLLPQDVARSAHLEIQKAMLAQCFLNK